MAQLRSTNPVFTNPAFRQQAATPTPDELRGITGVDRRLTVDDVVVHTGGLMVLLIAAGVVGWAITPETGAVPAVALFAMFIGLGLGLAGAFLRRLPPAVAIGYSLAEGVFLGAISKSYQAQFNGIVAQAALGTVAIFGVMLALHRSGRFVATPRLTRIVVGAAIGAVVLSLVNLLLAGFGSNLPGFSGSSPLALLVGLAFLVIGALYFTLDFAFIEQAVGMRAPASDAWRLSFGLVLSIVWVYLSLLRVLSILQGRS